jgi:hypothetical protein
MSPKPKGIDPGVTVRQRNCGQANNVVPVCSVIVGNEKKMTEK